MKQLVWLFVSVAVLLAPFSDAGFGSAGEEVRRGRPAGPQNQPEQMDTNQWERPLPTSEPMPPARNGGDSRAYPSEGEPEIEPSITTTTTTTTTTLASTAVSRDPRDKPKPPPDNEASTLMLSHVYIFSIAGAAVGLCALLLATFAIILVLCRRKKSKPQSHRPATKNISSYVPESVRNDYEEGSIMGRHTAPSYITVVGDGSSRQYMSIQENSSLSNSSYLAPANGHLPSQSSYLSPTNENQSSQPGYLTLVKS